MSVRKTKSGYKADVRDAAGQRHRKTFRTKKAAEQWERDMIDQAQQGVMPYHGDGTLGDFLDEWESTIRPGLRANTWSGYEKVVSSRLRPAFGDTPLRKIDQRLVQDWVNTLVAEDLNPRTVEFYFSVLSVIMKMAAEYGLCKPVRRAGRNGGGVRLPKKVKSRRPIPSPAEIMRLADAIDPRYRACVLVAGFCGLRQSEVFGLHPSAVDFERHKVIVRRTVEHATGSVVDLTKNGKDREATMATVVESALEQHIREHPHPDFVFHTRGHHLAATSFHHEIWVPAREAAGLDGVWFHSLRHSAASIMIGAGWSAKRVQTELGHHSAAFTLDQYGHLFAEDDAPARAGLNDALGAALNTAKSAGDGSRTHMPSRAPDLESGASAIPPRRHSERTIDDPALD